MGETSVAASLEANRLDSNRRPEVAQAILAHAGLVLNVALGNFNGQRAAA